MPYFEAKYRLFLVEMLHGGGLLKNEDTRRSPQKSGMHVPPTTKHLRPIIELTITGRSSHCYRVSKSRRSLAAPPYLGNILKFI
jgi:hypothetical protein